METRKSKFALQSTFAFVGITLVFLRTANAATETYRVGDFSTEFEAKVTVEEGDGVFRPGSVSVYERASGKRLIEVTSDELVVDMQQGVLPSNVVELPYGQQSVVIYEDVNFDGQKDLAIMDGQESCYHGPSFTIFLKTHRGFVESPAFTSLAHEYCGMFSVDVAKRQLGGMTKSGCCWHRTDTFAVIGNQPKVIRSVETRLAVFSPNYVETITTGKRTTYEYHLNPDEEPPMLSFALAGHPPKAVKILLSENTLDYALVVGQDERVEFSYQLDVNHHRAGQNAPDVPVRFSWAPEKRALSFTNGPFTYVVYDRKDKLGVEVITPQKNVFLSGVTETKRGSLDVLSTATIENLVLR